MDRYAFFDFDNTLSKGDSILSFLPFCILHGYASPFHLLRTGAAWIRKAVTGTKNFIPVKETTFSFLKGKTQEEIDRICIRFVDEVLARRLYPKGVREMERLRAEGWRTVIVSASSDLYMKHIGRILPVDDVLATRCVISDGIYTGKMEANCKGDAKVDRICEAFGLPAPENCICFGDSESDLPMLRLGGKRYLVNCRKEKILVMLPDAGIKYWKVSESK